MAVYAKPSDPRYALGYLLNFHICIMKNVFLHMHTVQQRKVSLSNLNNKNYLNRSYSYSKNELASGQLSNICYIIGRVTENSVSTIEFYRLFLTKSNGLC